MSSHHRAIKGMFSVFTVTVLLRCAPSSTSFDVPSCDEVFTVELQETTFSVSNSSIITGVSSVRSLKECIVNCKELFPHPCNAVFKSHSDYRCFELSEVVPVSDINSAAYFLTGTFVDLLPTRQEQCNGRDCMRNNEICVTGCGNTVATLPVCLADEEKKCGLSREYSNLRHYWAPSETDSRSTGSLFVATYPKKRSDSGLRVVFHISVRGHFNHPGGCTRWFVTFNEMVCSNPSSIENVDYSSGTGNHHRATDIDGTCYGLDSGDVTVRLDVHACHGYSVTGSYARYKTSTSVFIMELTPQSVDTDTINTCPELNVFNYQYYTWDEEIDDTFDSSVNSHLVKAVEYNKLADDTSLHIKYTAVTAVEFSSSTDYYFGQWFVRINGADCIPFLDFVLKAEGSLAKTYWEMHQRSRTLEGICDNILPAGTYSIEIWTSGSDLYAQPTRMLSGGFNTSSCLHVQEVRKDRAVDGVRNSINSIYKMHSSYLTVHNYFNLNSEMDSGDILSVSYTKTFSQTALRLTATGDHRMIIGNGGLCSRWYFKIDNSECRDPGAIDGIVLFDYLTNNHQPMQVSGICYGISSGEPHSITYAVAGCNGQDPDAHTAWQSSFNIFIEELWLEERKTCSGTPIDCDV